ncbi:hypothetical protein [Sphingobacterium sp. 1.A.5]|jgi:hypothetical protein|uniref:hypothetical protein n=1 Tax=Sphingobacterium sp. 1.A.5 TaxID=2044604 RepID=UPI000C0BEB6E|nr:hypothetical protein [Sphingobacterium sp. 1.A.5]
MGSYYREKIVKLHDVLFLNVNDVKESFIQNEEHWECAYLASKTLSDAKIHSQWEKIWHELNSKVNPYKGFETNFSFTISRKHKKTLGKYLLFVLEQYSYVRNK